MLILFFAQSENLMNKLTCFC